MGLQAKQKTQNPTTRLCSGYSADTPGQVMGQTTTENTHWQNQEITALHTDHNDLHTLWIQI